MMYLNLAIEKITSQPPKKWPKPKEVPKQKPQKEPQPPRGYDREALDRAMVHAYTDKELAAALGIGVWRVRKWLEWRFRD